MDMLEHKNKMKRFLLLTTGVLLIAATSQAQQQQKDPETTEIWEPQPRVITPGENPHNPPSDAIILFDGKNLSGWTAPDGSTPAWTVKDGAVTVTPGGKDIVSKQQFGDMQLHIEWRTPAEVDPSKVSQGRGNSGIFLQDRYEVQVLDNYNNKTYANGQAGSIYKQHIPLVNACKKPGEWQTYDIIFMAPRFNKEGRMIDPARVTVIHNGILVQNNVALWGPTEYMGLPVYKEHGKGPIKLQDHGNPVSFRNIWVREL